MWELWAHVERLQAAAVEEVDGDAREAAQALRRVGAAAGIEVGLVRAASWQRLTRRRHWLRAVACSRCPTHDQPLAWDLSLSQCVS